MKWPTWVKWPSPFEWGSLLFSFGALVVSKWGYDTSVMSYEISQATAAAQQENLGSVAIRPGR
jgi:hypothetical protein